MCNQKPVMYEKISIKSGVGGWLLGVEGDSFNRFLYFCWSFPFNAPFHFVVFAQSHLGTKNYDMVYA